ncbi:MAG: hypothetical protein IT281_09800 [Ignavibacteria bacterium]|nr:hypothetical protein [Ignavibacteria bacterium]
MSAKQALDLLYQLVDQSKLNGPERRSLEQALVILRDLAYPPPTPIELKSEIPVAVDVAKK